LYPIEFARISSCDIFADIGQDLRRESSSLLSTGKDASADFAQIALLKLDPLPDLFGRPLTPGQIVINLASMTKVVGDNRVHV
jgi:hypothetical protein